MSRHQDFFGKTNYALSIGCRCCWYVIFPGCKYIIYAVDKWFVRFDLVTSIPLSYVELAVVSKCGSVMYVIICSEWNVQLEAGYLEFAHWWQIYKRWTFGSCSQDIEDSETVENDQDVRLHLVSFSVSPVFLNEVCLAMIMVDSALVMANVDSRLVITPWIVYNVDLAEICNTSLGQQQQRRFTVCAYWSNFVQSCSFKASELRCFDFWDWIVWQCL